MWGLSTAMTQGKEGSLDQLRESLLVFFGSLSLFYQTEAAGRASTGDVQEK